MVVIGKGYLSILSELNLTRISVEGRLDLEEIILLINMYAFTGHPRLNYIQERLGLELRK